MSARLLGPGPSPILSRAMLVVSAALLASCGGTEPPPPPPPDTWAVQLDRDSVAMVPGDTTKLVADVRRNGTAAAGSVTWQTTAPQVAEVDAVGNVVAVGPGTAVVTAIAATPTGSVSDGAKITVAIGFLAGVARRIDTVKVLSDTTEVQGGTLRLQGTNAASYVPGTIVVRAEKSAPLLKKVKSSSQAGSEVVLAVEDASMTEAFQDLSWESENDLSLAPGPWASPTLTPVAAPWLAPGVSVTANGDLNLDGVELSLSFPVSGGTIATKVKVVDGFITFKPKLSASANIGFFKLKKFEITAGGNFGFTANRVDFTLSGTKAFKSTSAGGSTTFDPSDFKKSKSRLARFIFAAACAGPICWTSTLDFNIGIATTGTITGTVSTGVAANGFISAGARYKDGSWSGIQSSSGSTSSTPATFTIGGEAGLALTIEPSLSVKFYDVAGPFIALPATLGLTAGVDNWNWFVRARAALEAEVGGKVEFLSFELAKLSKTFTILEATTGTGGAAATLALTPATVSTGIGGSVQVGTQFKYLGLDWPTPPLTWSTTNPGIATVSNTGRVTGVASGTTQVEAKLLTNNAVVGRATVNVSAGALDLTVSPVTTSATRTEAKSWQVTVTSAGTPVAGATVTVANNLPSATVNQTLTTDAQGKATYTYTLGTVPFGARTLTFRATKAGLADAAPVTATVTVLQRLRMAVFPPDWQCGGNPNCPADGTVGPYAPSLTVLQWYDVMDWQSPIGGKALLPHPSPGNSRTFLVGMENLETNVGEPGVAVQVQSPFTSTVSTLTTAQHPVLYPGFAGVALYTFTVPQGTPPGTYSFKFGPATKSGFAPSLQLERKVIVQ